MIGTFPISRLRSAAWANELPRAASSPPLDCAVKRHGQFSLVEVELPRGATWHALARFVCDFKSVRERTAKTAAAMAS